MSFQLAELFVSVTSRGVTQIQAELDKVQRSLRGAIDWVQNFRSKLSAGPLSLMLKIHAENQGIISELRGQLEALPKDVRIKVIQEKIGAIDKALPGLTGDQRKAAIALRNDMAGLMTELNKKPTFFQALKEGERGIRQMHRAIAPFQQAISQVGAIGTKVFAGISAAMVGGVKLASPGDFEKFTAALKLASAEIGTIFLPLIRQVTRWLNDLSAWFDRLTDAQKDQILHWAKIGLAVGAFLMVLPKLTGVLTAVMMGFKLFMLALNAMLVSNPAGWLITVVAAVAALAIGLYTLIKAVTSADGATSGWLGAVKKVFMALWETAKQVWTWIMDFFGKVADSFEAMIESFGINWDDVVEALKVGISFLADAFKGFLDIVMWVVQNTIKAVLGLVVIVKRAVASIKDFLKLAGEVILHPVDSAKKAFKGQLKNPFEGMNPADIAKEINEEVSKFDENFGKKQQERNNPKTNPNDHKIMPARQENTFVGIAEQARKIQQSIDPNDPALKLLKVNEQQLDNQQRQINLLETIANVKGFNPFNQGATAP